jgi:putative membrane protein insertion efficiency factor
MNRRRLPIPVSATHVPRLLALRSVRAYQLLVRPMLAGSGACRFVPSCSEYAAQAITKHGAVRGGWMALRRVLRCHPFGGRGFDPVS